MNRSATIAAAAILSTIASQPVAAEDGDFVTAGGMDVAFKSLTLTPGASTPLNTTMVSLNPNLAIGFKDFYLSVGYDRSVYSENDLDFDNGYLPQVITLTRSDLVATLGYRFLNYFSVFAGWLRGNTAFSIQGVRNFGTAGDPHYTVIDGHYIEQGPFAGISGSYTFGKRGSLSISVAYADLRGTLSQVRYSDDPLNPYRYDSYDADSSGLSYGLIWTGPLTGNLQYRLGAKLTAYKGNPLGSGTDTVAIKEDYTSYFMGIVNYF